MDETPSQSPPPEFPEIARIEHPPGWAGEEFGAVDLGDVRRTRRLVGAADSMRANPGASVPEVSAGWGDCKGTYGLLNREELTDKVVLDAHREATMGRAAQSGEPVLLAVQDTTSLNFTSHAGLDGQGPVGRGGAATGFHLHNTLLVGAVTGEVFGLAGAKIYAREAGKRAAQTPGERNREPIGDKESYRWLESYHLARRCHRELGERAAGAGAAGPEVVSVCDREGDIYELLLEAEEHRDEGVHLLVRSQHDRALVPPGTGGEGEGEGERLWEALAASPKRGEVAVEVPRNATFKKREVLLEIRHMEVVLDVPAHRRKYAGMTRSVRATVVELREAGGGADAILWRLVTTLPVAGVADAARLARWYALRWLVEVLHRVLKTGCRVERRQMRTEAAMRPMIAMDLAVACYIMSMVGAARSRPEEPATRWLGEDGAEALGRFHGRPPGGAAAMKIGEAVALIGKLGGHLGRKSDGPPGAEVVWRGRRKLETITQAWRAFKGKESFG